MRFLFWKRTPTVIQMEALECGAAALSMILGYYGRFVSLEKLRIECAVSRDGSKASNILKAARLYGLKAKGYNRDLEELKALDSPTILFWEFNHFVVLERVVGKKYYLNDPAIGRRILSEVEFSRSFTGVVLEFELGPEFQRSGEKPRFYSDLFSPFRGHYFFLIFSIWAAILFSISAVLIPALMRAIVDDILIKDLDIYLMPLLGAAGMLFLFRAVLTYLQKRHLGLFASSYSVHISAGTFWHILRLPMQFFSQRFIGDIASRVPSGMRIASIATQHFYSLLCAVLIVVLLSLVLGYYSVKIALVCLSLFVFNLAVFVYLLRKKKDLEQRLRIERDRALSNLINGLSSIETLKASGREPEFFARFSGLWAKANNVKNNISASESLLSVVPTIFAAISSAVIWLLGSIEYFSASMSIGMLIAVRFLSEQFFQSIDPLTQAQGEMDVLVYESRRINDVRNYPIAPQWKSRLPQSGSTFDQAIMGNVSVKNLFFGYDRYAPAIIEDISFDIKPGSRIAFVGATGSGKSTIGKLIAGFYEPRNGEIYFDGVDRTQIPHDIITKYVAYVEQDIYLYSGNIAENLSMFDKTIPWEDVVKAAKDAMIHDDIVSIFGGYESSVAEGGKNLSGGQIQRLEIARALVRNPSVLILDEATSALDPPTEKLIDENLKRRGCTLIVVAHRLSTIRDSDEIIVLDNGRIAQRGKHEQLMNESGPYQNLIQKSG